MDVTHRNVLAISQVVATLEARFREMVKIVESQSAAIAAMQSRQVELETSVLLLRAGSMGRGATA